MIIENCTDYYGFLNGVDIVTAGKLVEKLQAEMPEKYAFKGLTVGSEIIEEIMRHPGVEILPGEEAAKVAPWEINYKDINYIRFKYLPDEPIPDDPGYAEYDWYIPTFEQYAYACYLKRNIDAGLITLN
ncbi:MAG: hypothetical protein IJY73_10500 [Oscillospiraceae bacterium]|nr:hypothetical protein [Oscillospiraceae bacterium]